MQYLLTRDQYADLAGRHEKTWAGYEGRAMFGRTCLAYTGDQPVDFIDDLADTLAERTGVDPAELRGELARSQRTDALGLGQIVYWPTIQVDR